MDVYGRDTPALRIRPPSTQNLLYMVSDFLRRTDRPALESVDPHTQWYPWHPGRVSRLSLAVPLLDVFGSCDIPHGKVCLRHGDHAVGGKMGKQGLTNPRTRGRR